MQLYNYDHVLMCTKFNIKQNYTVKLSNKVAKIRNRYNQVPHLTQDTNGKVTNSQKTPQTKAKRSALSQQALLTEIIQIKNPNELLKSFYLVLSIIQY